MHHQVNEKIVFNKIQKIRMVGVKFHHEMSRIMLNMRCRHFNRLHEKHELEENFHLRAIERFWQHYGDGTSLSTNPSEVDAKVKEYFKGLEYGDSVNRYEISTAHIPQKLRQYWVRWVDVESDVIKQLNDLYYEMLLTIKNAYFAHEILKEICDVEQELKYIKVCLLEYDNVDWDLKVICSPSYVEKSHDHYKEEAEKMNLNEYI